ncbi:hypothetical protein HMI55_006885 [Coelomomyces lativittatus]|nr:hypothetical protein HMI55_006885 [Coelomomyces lativittatus]KAJ1513407.1 hypothetical protein HMI56_002509 [Coelomomyces lativittatus]
MSPSLLKSNFEPFSLLQQEVSPCIVEVVPTPCSLNLNPPTSKLASNKPLLVCDFDCSLIEVDSDEFVLGFYGGISLVENLRNAYKSGTGSWLQSVAHAMSQLFSNRKIPSLDALKKRLAQIPMDPSTLKMLRDLSQSGVDIIIISDANTFFIETILEVLTTFVIVLKLSFQMW